MSQSNLTLTLILVFVLLISPSHGGPTRRERIDLLKTSRICSKELNFPREAANRLIRGYLDRDDEEAQCFVKCMYVKTRIMSEEGEINEDRLTKALPKSVFPKEKVPQWIETCRDVEAETVCERAYKTYACFLKLAFPEDDEEVKKNDNQQSVSGKVFFLGLTFAEQNYKNYGYIHDATAVDCQTKYEYTYNLTHLNKPTRVTYSVELFVRQDKTYPDALLFYFNNLVITENTNHKEGDTNYGILSNFPVRVSYHTDGKLNKIETNAGESDFSYHIKKGIISTLQLPWQNVQDALHDKGPFEFDINITAKSSTCKINHQVHKINDNEFGVTATRRITDCDNTQYFQSDYQKFKESKKVWKYHFDTVTTKNLHHVDIDIEDYFKMDENILIKSKFMYKGCKAIDGEWDDKNLENIYRKFTPSEY
uniref:CSON005618 protein n=1 Tax=Culicoides sonorensis TaxID=179676 RepID=A0A336LY63_CULSO